MLHDEDEMRQMCGRIAARQWSRLFSRSGDLSVRGTQAWLIHCDNHDSLSWSMIMINRDDHDTRQWHIALLFPHLHLDTKLLWQKSHFQRTLYSSFTTSIFYPRLTHSLLALSSRKSTSRRSIQILILKYFRIKHKKSQWLTNSMLKLANPDLFAQVWYREVSHEWLLHVLCIKRLHLQLHLEELGELVKVRCKK